MPITENKPVNEQIIAQTEKGSGTILIVDDEKNVRNIAADMLKSLDYDILTAENGIQAIDIYREKRDEINLIILDVIMPEMDGMDTFNKIRELNPEAKIIFASGYSHHKETLQKSDDRLLGFIEKPFRLHELSKVVRGKLSNITITID